MSDLDKLVALGAQPVGGDLIWKHKVLGKFRNGVFAITEEGEAALQVEDVPFKEVELVKKPTKAKAKAAPEPTPEPTPEPAVAEPEVVTNELDDLLGEMG